MKIKKTRILIDKLKPFWKEMRERQSTFFKDLKDIEEEMEKKSRIKGLFFFMCDDEIVGIGNDDRTLELINDSELE